MSGEEARSRGQQPQYQQPGKQHGGGGGQYKEARHGDRQAGEEKKKRIKKREGQSGRDDSEPKWIKGKRRDKSMKRSDHPPLVFAYPKGGLGKEEEEMLESAIEQQEVKD